MIRTKEVEEDEKKNWISVCMNCCIIWVKKKTWKPFSIDKFNSHNKTLKMKFTI